MLYQCNSIPVDLSWGIIVSASFLPGAANFIRWLRFKQCLRSLGIAVQFCITLENISAGTSLIGNSMSTRCSNLFAFLYMILRCPPRAVTISSAYVFARNVHSISVPVYVHFECLPFIGSADDVFGSSNHKLEQCPHRNKHIVQPGAADHSCA